MHCGRARLSRRRALPARRRSCASLSGLILPVPRALAPMHAALLPPAWPRTGGSTCSRTRLLPVFHPSGWATKAVAAFHRLKADALVAEVNMGGDMVRAVLAQVDPEIPLRTVHATRGKWVRAEPVALMYQQGKIRHVDPPMQALEDEMCDFGISGLSSGASPDRLDALVWAVTELVARGMRGARVRLL